MFHTSMPGQELHLPNQATNMFFLPMVAFRFLCLREAPDGNVAHRPIGCKQAKVIARISRASICSFFALADLGNFPLPTYASVL